MVRTARSSGTSSPRDSSRSRNRLVMTVRTTSLTVPPSAARTVFTSLRRTLAQRHTRCGPIGPVSDDASDWAQRTRGLRHRARGFPVRAQPLAGSAQRLLDRAELRPRAHDAVRDGARQDLGAGGLGLRSPLSRRRGIGGVGEHHGHQVGGRDAVDHAVVDLGKQRPAPLARALDHADLPRRPAAVQVLREHPAGHLARPVLAAGRGGSPCGARGGRG
jgi:hypothetical protein